MPIGDGHSHRLIAITPEGVDSFAVRVSVDLENHEWGEHPHSPIIGNACLELHLSALVIRAAPN
jgi:hypothetical protein